MCVYFHHQSVVLYNLYNGTEYLRVGAEHALELLVAVYSIIIYGIIIKGQSM